MDGGRGGAWRGVPWREETRRRGRFTPSCWPISPGRASWRHLNVSRKKFIDIMSSIENWVRTLVCVVSRYFEVWFDARRCDIFKLFCMLEAGTGHVTILSCCGFSSGCCQHVRSKRSTGLGKYFGVDCTFWPLIILLRCVQCPVAAYLTSVYSTAYCTDRSVLCSRLVKGTVANYL